jgi:hypothetical protein
MGVLTSCSPWLTAWESVPGGSLGNASSAKTMAAEGRRERAMVAQRGRKVPWSVHGEPVRVSTCSCRSFSARGQSAARLPGRSQTRARDPPGDGRVRARGLYRADGGAARALRCDWGVAVARRITKLSATFRRSVVDLGILPRSPGYRAAFATLAVLADAEELPGPADDETRFGVGHLHVRRVDDHAEARRCDRARRDRWGVSRTVPCAAPGASPRKGP